MNKGMLIVIEGIDGAGKSTLAQSLAQQLQKDGHSVLLTKEPGGSKLGKQLRTILQTQPIPITPIAEYLLFAADRAQHIEQVVKPALEKGIIVISDRMADSSLAYQGYGRGIDRNHIRSINTWAMQNVQPNIVFYLKINAAQAIERLATRITVSAFEKENISFIERLITGFDEIFAQRTNVISLDGTLDPQTLTTIACNNIYSWHQQ
jgi:dTMP kinase